MHFIALSPGQLLAAALLVSTSLASAQSPAPASGYVRGSIAAVLGDAQGRLTQGNPNSGFPGELYAQTPDFGIRDHGALSVALGRHFTPTLRAELEVRHAKSKFDSSSLNGSGARTADIFALSGAVRSTSVLVSGAYDVQMGASAWQPYLKAGVGVTRHTADANLSATITAMGVTSPTPNPFPAGTRSDFTWAVGGGVAYALSADASLDLGYRYLDMGTAKTGADGFGDTVNTKMRAHEVSVGVSYRF